MSKRIGANRLKTLNEQKARKTKRFRKSVPWCIAFAVLVAMGTAAYPYVPGVVEQASERIEKFRILPVKYEVENCSSHTESLVECVLDSLIRNDSLPFKRSILSAELMKIPAVEKVKIRKSFGKKTVITVTERKPVAIVHRGDFCLVDDNGVAFPAVSGVSYDLPLVVGLNQNASAFGEFMKIRNRAKRLSDSFYRQISQIDLKDSGLVGFTFKTGSAVYKMRSEDVRMRLVHMKNLREELQKEFREPEVVDLRYRSLAFVTTVEDEN
ncbi:MAG: cell division protein FtsQ/DivIB [Chitinispirillaceae bacterium]